MISTWWVTPIVNVIREHCIFTRGPVNIFRIKTGGLPTGEQIVYQEGPGEVLG